MNRHRPAPENELGHAIRTARRAAHLSQSETAAALGVRQSSVSQWERGTTLPKTRHLLQLLKLFGTGLTRLLVSEKATAGTAIDLTAETAGTPALLPSRGAFAEPDAERMGMPPSRSAHRHANIPDATSEELRCGADRFGCQ